MSYIAFKEGTQNSLPFKCNIQPWCTPFPIWNQSVVPYPVLTVASSPAYRFLRRQVRWYGIPIYLKIYQFDYVHLVEGFGIVNKAEIDVFLELLPFRWSSGCWHLISDSSAFSKSSLNIWKFQFMYCWSLAWRILSITLLVCQMSAIVC